MTDECSVEGCSEPIMTRGWCCTHYHRVIRHGTPAGSGRPIRGSVKQFILDNAGHTGDECLIWPFNRSSKHGYAVIRKEHFGSGMAHRSMCIVAHGPPPTDKHEAAHSCGKGHKGCVNPRHLSWKTPTENNRDKHRHGTQPWGEGMWHMAKLTREQAVRAKHGNEPANDLAAEFGVTPETIRRIRRNETWRGL